MPRWILSTTLIALILASGCDSPAAPDDELEGGILATFSVSGETFRVWMTNPDAIEQVLALRQGTSRANIPNGALKTGPGRGNHNRPYSWHLDPDDIAMAEMTIELCDGRPSWVEANRDRFVAEVGRYCPWSAELRQIADYR